ncbi:hypothetical protein C2S51_029270 [Perilla frutescens var. frutescens]|nr:hypothetical protein C2S51_029270 [Perilla frutescens var. frutescens]
MDSQCNSSSLSLELRLIRTRNICVNTSREVFVRCYLSTSSNKRVRIDSQEIPSSNSNLINQTFSLNCCGNQETIKSLKQRTIVFELRCRSRAPNFLARIGGSKLLARAEMPWNDVVGKDEEKWIVMIAKDRHVYSDDVKPPAVKIAMKVEEFSEMKEESGRRKFDDDCGCNCMDCGCNSCHVDYELFALGRSSF